MALSPIKVTGINGNFLGGIVPETPGTPSPVARSNIMTNPKCGQFFQVSVTPGNFYIDFAPGVALANVNLIINGQIQPGIIPVMGLQV